jgi:hypothetical protein
MKTALRTLALIGVVGFTMLAGDVSTAKAGPYWGRPGYRRFYPGVSVYAYPYAYGYPGYYAGYYPGYYGYASPGISVGGYWGGRGYWGHGYYGHGYWGRGGHWRR